MTKRLKKACQQRLNDTCKTIKRSPCKCNCNKCAEIRLMHKQRVMALSSLNSLAHQEHSSHHRPIMDFDTTQINPESINNELIQSSRQDHRDLYMIIYVSYLVIICLTFLTMKFIYGFGAHPSHRRSSIFQRTNLRY
ncbi:hypothetical protein PV325_012516 [Microctonus aethiopoides]|uniref:Uncharacterized protein n=1 Tax=Microctonus aethiopoides TaxID=144406 RepID=A0AA39KKX6_9HYME|nr:hypothetical protein PV325_012516 [Microctonus aethiopoides]KAK0165162.1 hypothetical protein PV328_003707 [Microctonus aethiopoides]